MRYLVSKVDILAQGEHKKKAYRHIHKMEMEKNVRMCSGAKCEKRVTSLVRRGQTCWIYTLENINTGFPFPLTALDLQRAGLSVQREAAEVHVAHGGDSDSAGKMDTKENKHCNLTSSSNSNGEFTNVCIWVAMSVDPKQKVCGQQ